MTQYLVLIYQDEQNLGPFGSMMQAHVDFQDANKEALRGGEAMVHHIIIVLGIASCVLLCAAYSGGPGFAITALVLTLLSFLYSLVDEVMHWRRYLTGRSDVVEMWSHVFILLGHGVMMTGWWLWYAHGYRGVAETLVALGLGPS